MLFLCQLPVRKFNSLLHIGECGHNIINTRDFPTFYTIHIIFIKHGSKVIGSIFNLILLNLESSLVSTMIPSIFSESLMILLTNKSHINIPDSSRHKGQPLMTKITISIFFSRYSQKLAPDDINPQSACTSIKPFPSSAPN